MLSIHNKTTLLGTENEKKKFSLIQEFCSAISDLTHWAPIETAFSDIPCVKFAIENTGTAIDEDIEITIRFDKQTMMRISEFPPLDCATIEF